MTAKGQVLTLKNHDLPATVERALLDLIGYLRNRNYHFITPTPATQDVVVGRGISGGLASLANVLGWNFSFASGSIDPVVEDYLTRANAMETTSGASRSLIRVARLHDDLFVHSGFPTTDSDAVFFGPDSYRFADLIERELGDFPLADGARIVDIGTGSGVGAVAAARVHRHAQIAITDINPKALQFARINAAAAGVAVEARLGSELAGITGQVDVALANPPYIIDPGQRLYRDGGGALGGDVSLRIARAAIDRLAPGGRLILYTGSAISHGRDAFKQDVSDLAASVGATLRYREIDPDVFGEELRGAAYRHVDRIAIVAAIVDMRK